mgnify:CR=1 FL=1
MKSQEVFTPGDLFGACVLGGIYGLVTAAAAITSRKKNFK